MLLLDRMGLSWFGEDPAGRLRLGAVGLALASGMVSWLDLWLLRRRVRQILPNLLLPWLAAARVLLAALLAVVPAAGVWLLMPELHSVLVVTVVLSLYGASFLAAAKALRVPELRMLGRRFA